MCDSILPGIFDMCKDYLIQEENRKVLEQEFVDPLICFMGKKLFPIILTFVILLFLMFVMIAYLLYKIIKK